jgi:hypothetical protein
MDLELDMTHGVDRRAYAGLRRAARRWCLSRYLKGFRRPRLCISERCGVSRPVWVTGAVHARLSSPKSDPSPTEGTEVDLRALLYY